METTASWRLLPPGGSSRLPALLRHNRQASFSSFLQRPANSRSRILCLLHDKPAPAAQSSVQLQKLVTVLQCGAAWAAVEAPAALATVSGEEDVDLLGILPPIAAFAFVYLFVAPPIIMNWMRQRWFKRKFVEMYRASPTLAADTARLRESPPEPSPPEPPPGDSGGSGGLPLPSPPRAPLPALLRPPLLPIPVAVAAPLPSKTGGQERSSAAAFT